MSLVIDLYVYADTLILLSVLCGMEKFGFSVIKQLALPFYYNYWFIGVYLLLFIMSPLINAGFEAISKEQAYAMTYFFTLIFCVFGFILKADFLGLNKGYSLIFAIYLYYLGRMMSKYGFFKHGQRKQIYCWLFNSIIVAMLTSGLYLKGKSATAWDGFAYNNIFIVFSAVSFVWMFLNLNKQYFSWSAGLSRHVLLIYYIHCSEPIGYLLWIPLWWMAKRFLPIAQILMLVPYAMLVFVICLVVDAVKCRFLSKIEISFVMALEIGIRNRIRNII